jgi:CheY-like chemotaxis protein
MAKGLILLVDDEDIVRMTSEEILSELGFDVLTASCAHEALDIMKDKSSQISLVILDMTLPDKSGKEICISLRELNPDLKILFTSGMSIDDYKELQHCQSNGSLISFIQKPYTLSELNSAIESILGK